jgi:hypothetical protein
MKKNILIGLVHQLHYQNKYLIQNEIIEKGPFDIIQSTRNLKTEVLKMGRIGIILSG